MVLTEFPGECSHESCGVVCFGSCCKSMSASSDEVFILVVLRKNTVKVFVLVE